MKRLAQIEAHLHSMAELRDLVSAMRALASMRMQEAQRTLPGIRRYAQAIADAIADTLLLMRESPPIARHARVRTARVLCLAEHGFVGAFNEHLIDAAQAQPAPGDRLFVLGSRGAAIARERGSTADWFRPMASRSAAAPESVHPLTAQLYRHIAAGEIDRVEVLYARSRTGAAPGIERRLLLPLDVQTLARRQLRQPPLHNLPAEMLHAKLMAEYVFARLTEAVVESIASENAARFAAMAAAYDNVSEKLEALRHDANRARQSEITIELLDLIAGAQALMHPPR